MTGDPLKVFVVEYSITQNSTHTRTLQAMLENNRRNLSRGLPSDYVPVGLLNSREEADKFEAQFHQTLNQQAQLEFRSRNWHRISEVLEQLLPQHLNFGPDDQST